MDLVENIAIFRRVAERRSFSAVAHELGVTQPTISKAIANLENRLEVSLFRRSTRGLSLTPEGQKLFDEGGRLVEHRDEVLASVKSEKLRLTGELRMTASLAFARLILAPLLDRFTDQHPGLKLSFQLSDAYLNLIENGIDVAIRIGDLPDSGLKALKIGRSARCLYASHAYVKRHGKPQSLESLREHRLLYYTRLSERPCWPLRKANGDAMPFYFEPFFQSDGSDLLREVMLGGMGIVLAPTWMMIEPERDGQVVRLLEEHAPSPSPIFLTVASTKDMTAKQRAVADFLERSFEGIPSISRQTKTSRTTNR